MLYSGSRLPAMHFVKHFNGSPLNKHPAAVKRTGQQTKINALFSKNVCPAPSL